MWPNEGDSPPKGGAQGQRSALHDGTTPLRTVLDTLGVPRQRPVLVVIGWADSTLDADTQDAVALLMRTAVARVCSDEAAVIVSGGTDTGVMAALGKAVAEQPGGPVLVGVAPDAMLIGYGAEPHNDHAALPEPQHRLIRTPGSSWGAEGPSLVRVAECIAEDRAVVLLAVGGGDGTRREIALAARRQWPAVLITGSSGASAEVADYLGITPLEPRHQPALGPGRSVAKLEAAVVGQVGPRGPGVAVEAVARELPPIGQVGPVEEQGTAASVALANIACASTADLKMSVAREEDLVAARNIGCYVAVNIGERAGLERALRWRLRDDDVLKDAWTRFALADATASARKKPTARLALAVLALATLTVLSAIGAAWLRSEPAFAKSWALDASYVVKGLITALPIAAAVLLGLIDRRARTGSWIELRAAAESTIREIYRFRASAAPFGEDVREASRLLADALADFDTRTSGRSLVSWTATPATRGGWPPSALWDRVLATDTLLGPLTARGYDEARVQEQLAHFDYATRRSERRATLLSTLIFVVAGSAAFLFALSWKEPSLAVVAAIPASLAVAFMSWREYGQRDARADTMLATSVAVRAARGRWLSLEPGERGSLLHLRTLVAEVEEALATEGSDWERGLRQSQQGFMDRHRGR